MYYDRNQILIKQLPTAVFIKNFIEGHPADYEQYLTEFVNLSKLVSEKGNEEFVLRKQEEQSQGQNDIYNFSYELDFKILADETYMEAKSMLTHSLTEVKPGVTLVGTSKIMGRKTVFDIIKCYRGKTLGELESIENKVLRIPEAKMIRQTLKKLSVNKNILYFFPYDYSFQSIETNIDIANLIVGCVSDDLKGLLEYRKKKVAKDTYISFISSGYFIIAQEKKGKLVFYDMIQTSASALYNYLYNVGRL